MCEALDNVIEGNLSQAISQSLSISVPSQTTQGTPPLSSTPRLPYPPRDIDPLNEWNTNYLAAMAFPTLFPTGQGDLWKLSSHSNSTSFIIKFRHLLRYSEYNPDGSLEFRFASHPRFVLWLYNIHYRHRALSQGDIYLKQNPGDANLTIEEIQELLINTDRNNSVLKRIQRYMSLIPATSSYWYSISCQLKAIIDSKGPPHIFFTFSFADRLNSFIWLKI